MKKVFKILNLLSVVAMSCVLICCSGGGSSSDDDEDVAVESTPETPAVSTTETPTVTTIIYQKTVWQESSIQHGQGKIWKMSLGHA
ncbi:MAG: hypothetical protein J5817_10790 [Treponema sp.]|nr:hypothetical protein [Treponema sp.]